VQLPDGQDRSAQINGARVVPLLSTALCLTSVDPPPVVLFSLPPFPCCRVSSIHLSLVVLVALLSPPSTHFLPRVPLPFHIRFSPKGEFVLPSSPHQPRCPPPWFIPCLPLCHHPHSSPLLPRAPRYHHTYHSPCPPRWPSCPSLKISSYSRWQREKSSGSRSAELAGPLSIPRSSYGGS
jgi:hypothetical protein